MKISENDRKLKEMMKGIRLESPGPDFTSRVMEAILTETQKKPAFVTEPLLGKKFWILVTAFVGLALVMMLFNTPEPGTGSVQQFFSSIPTPDLSPVREFLSSAFSKTGSMTWTVMVIMLGASGLIFADRLIEKMRTVSLT